MSATPPRYARALLQRVAPPDDGAFIVGDLDEEFTDRVAHGESAAKWWYRAQVLISIAPLLRLRLAAHADARRTYQTRQRPPRMNGLGADIRDAARRALRAPLSTATIVFICALGVGASTAVYSVVHAVLLSPLPFAGSDRVVRLETIAPEMATNASYLPSDTWTDFVDWRAAAKSYEVLAGIWEGGTSRVFSLPDQTSSFPVAVVTERFDDVLGVRPLVGRSFRAEEFLPEGPRAIALTERFWLTRFSGDSSVVGRTITVSDTSRLVVGVLADANDYPGPVAAWIPVAPVPGRSNAGRGSSWLALFGRMKRGVTPQDARVELQTLIARTAETDQQRSRVARVTPISQIITGPVRPVLMLLAAVVLVALLVACGNVALLLLAQSEARARELAIRLSLGSAPSRLARKLVVESLMVAVVGGIAGIGVSRVLVATMIAFYPGRMARAQEIGLNMPVLMLALAATFMVGLLGAWPTLRRLRRADLITTLRDGAGASSARAVRIRNMLTVAQLAFAVALVASGGLLTRTFIQLLHTDPGFRAEGVAFIGINTSPARYPDKAELIARLNASEDVVRALPGVKAAGAVNYLPLPSRIAGWGTRVFRADDATNREYQIQFREMTPGYLEVMSVPLKAGRTLRSTDGSSDAPVALVNESFAKSVFPNETPVGHNIRLQSKTFTIVGVVGDMHYWGLAKPVVNEVYVTAAQAFGGAFRSIAIKIDGDAAAILAAARTAIRNADPTVVVTSSGTLDDRLSAASAPERFRALLVGALAALALLLAGLGLFAVTAHAVAQRTREIGIRVALGATGRRVRVAVMRDTLRLGAAGTLFGLALAWAASKGLQEFLSGAPGFDVTMAAGVAALFTVVALVAGLVPAWRASRVDPLVAMRGDQ